jgi:hypothetical protein
VRSSPRQRLVNSLTAYDAHSATETRHAHRNQRAINSLRTESALRHAHRPELRVHAVLANDHRTSTVNVDTDILSIQRASLSCEEEQACDGPSLNRLGPHGRRGPAPSSHQLCMPIEPRIRVEGLWSGQSE